MYDNNIWKLCGKKGKDGSCLKVTSFGFVSWMYVYALVKHLASTTAIKSLIQFNIVLQYVQHICSLISWHVDLGWAVSKFYALVKHLASTTAIKSLIQFNIVLQYVQHICSLISWHVDLGWAVSKLFSQSSTWQVFFLVHLIVWHDKISTNGSSSFDVWVEGSRLT